MSLGRVALLSLKRKRLRTILLVVSVAISMSILTGVNAGVEGLQRTYRDMVTTSLGYTDLIVQSNSSSWTLQKTSVEPFLQDESVAAYSWRIQYGTPFTSSNERFKIINWAFIVGADPRLDEEFGDYVMVGGDFGRITDALKSEPDSCVLNEYYAKRMDLRAGDILYVGSYNISEPVPAEPESVVQLKVVGIIRDYGRAYWFDPKDPDDFVKINGELFLSLATAQNLLDIPSDNVTQVYVHVKDMTKTDVFKSVLQQNLGAGYSIANLKTRMLASVEQSFANYRSIAAVIGGMSLMIAVMLLLNSMFAAVGERKYEVGVMRSIGASRGQIFLVFVIEVLFIAVAGALFSVPLSVMTTKMITTVMPEPYIQNVGQPSTAIEFVYSSRTVLFTLSAGITITAAIGLMPSISAARLDIVRALRPQMRVSHTSKRWRILMPVAGLILIVGGLFLIQAGFAGTATWIPSATALVGYAATLIGAVLLASLALPALSRAFSYLLTPFLHGTAMMVHRNIVLNFRRSVFAYGAFAISIALMISLSSLVITVASYDLTATKYASGADVQVWVSAPASFSEVLRGISGVKNVAGVAYVYQSNMSFSGHYLHGGNVQIVGVNSTEYFQTIYKTHLTATMNDMTSDEVYSALTAQSGNIILQDALARNLTAEVGDTVTCVLKNQTNTMEADFKVIATTDFVSGAWQTLYKSATTWGYHVAIVRSTDLTRYRDSAIGGSNMDQFYVSLASNANVTQVVDDLDQECRAHGYNLSIGTAQDSVEKAQSSYSQIEVLTLSVTTFSIIISALGIMAAMAYTVLERKREIGVLMALGLDRRQNMAIIIGEIVFLAVLGTVIGLSSGFGLTYFVLQVIPWWINLPQPSLLFSSYTLLISGAVIIVSAVVSSAYPADRVAKLNVVDALRK